MQFSNIVKAMREIHEKSIITASSSRKGVMEVIQWFK